MRAGNLLRRVLIQKRVVTQDSFKQQVTNWIDFLTNVPADIQALSGRELIAAQAVNAEVTHLIVLRFHPLLVDPVQNAALRVVYQPAAGVYRYLNVSSSINVDERNVEINFLAAEGPNKG
jgi:SPP1 family predicted phage head-tail adaptor